MDAIAMGIEGNGWWVGLEDKCVRTDGWHLRGVLAVSACLAAFSGLMQWDCAVTPALSAEATDNSCSWTLILFASRKVYIIKEEFNYRAGLGIKNIQ